MAILHVVFLLIQHIKDRIVYMVDLEEWSDSNIHEISTCMSITQQPLTSMCGYKTENKWDFSILLCWISRYYVLNRKKVAFCNNETWMFNQLSGVSCSANFNRNGFWPKKSTKSLLLHQRIASLQFIFNLQLYKMPFQWKIITFAYVTGMYYMM